MRWRHSRNCSTGEGPGIVPLALEGSSSSFFSVYIPPSFLGHSTHPSPQGVCELVEEIKQVLINYDSGQHVVEGVQRDSRRGGKKDIGVALQKR